MAACQSSAQSAGAVRTLLQRVRPIPGLNSRQFQERQAAQRKVVNSIIQVCFIVLTKRLPCELHCINTNAVLDQGWEEH
jgi:DNA polymerase I-like protein with 3'-5' exonuclease and polymerase domains